MNSAPLPPSAPTESKLKRDDWMMLDPVISTPIETQTVSSKRSNVRMDEDTSLTEDYGEPTADTRTLGGGVDFFSSLGTERKKNRPEKPDPSKVLKLLT